MNECWRKEAKCVVCRMKHGEHFEVLCVNWNRATVVKGRKALILWHTGCGIKN